MDRRPINELVFPGDGEMSALMRAKDWSQTALGPVDRWPNALGAAVRIVLTSRFPMWMAWGDDLTFFYNDAYRRDTLGTKHPWALGQSAREVWREIWPAIGPLIAGVLAEGRATWNEGMLLILERSGYREETYHTFSYSPLHDDEGAVRGMLCVVTEETGRVLSERRVTLLGRLAAEIAGTNTEDGVLRGLERSLHGEPRDFPFTITYRFDEAGVARRVSHSGFAPDEAPPPELELRSETTWGLAEVLATGQARLVPLATASWPTAPWRTPPTTGFVVPLAQQGLARPAGVLIAGLNPHREFDAAYREFASLFGGQLAAGLANARAYEHERSRAESLAELDRAKTAFFSNISHEFRTPLTLMIGPTEDALADPARALRGEALDALYRNELRLLKLVNGLLDFSRIEAGRMKASPELVDLSALTADVASGFRPAIERAGLTFEVVLPSAPVFARVDRDMWEKIELNLLSNAFKFTFEGGIRVSLEQAGADLALRVADTGIGIPAHELPRTFERFHRIENARARTHEGSGIGLALVQELTRLHDGTVAVESELGRGTTFTVSMPAGAVEPDRAERAVVRTPRGVPSAYLEESRPAGPGAAPAAPRPPADATILVADDNADMRDYLRRLLEEHWTVIPVADGVAAVETARRVLPDLIVTDVMMPRLDGFGVLSALRDDDRTRAIPVLMLSARAGDEARVEGLAAGADDYLIKPFSARELVARVRTHLTIARARRRAESELGELYALMMQVPAAIAVWRGPDHRVVFQNTAALAARDIRGMSLSEAWAGRVPAEVLAQLERTLREGEVVVEREAPVVHQWTPDAAPETRYWDLTSSPLRLADARIDGVITVGLDVTERVSARQRVEESEERRRLASEAAGVGTWRVDLATELDTRDAALNRLLGLPEAETVQAVWQLVEHVHAEDRARARASLERSLRDGSDYAEELRIVWPDGSVRWIRNRGRAVVDRSGRRVALTGAAVDITQQRRLMDEALAAGRAKDEFLAVLGHELRNPLAPIVTALALIDLRGDGRSKEYAIIARQVRHMSRLVDDLLDISRITRGTIELAHERLELVDVIAKALEIARPLLEQHRHALAIELPPEIWISGDGVRLAQVFANLLTNAARYTPDGGHVRVSAGHDGGRAWVRVADNGIGIAAPMLDRVFGLFVQGDSRPAHIKASGLGIGLALVKNLVTLHGGSVRASSPGEGRGSEFTVELPLAAADHRVDAVAPPPAPAPAPRRVLVVDDNVDAGESLTDLLRDHGHEVMLVHDAPEALAVFAQFRPDLAILDIGLPTMDGYQLAARIRELVVDTPYQLIALTGYGTPQDHQRSETAGFAGHLVKPLDFRKLTALMQAR